MDVERKKYDVCQAGLGRHAEDRGDGDPVQTQINFINQIIIMSQPEVQGPLISHTLLQEVQH